MKSGHRNSPPAVRGLCNCWCESWAEILIRRPSGNVSWIMRVQNERGVEDGEKTALPLADIHALLTINSNHPTNDSENKSSYTPSYTLEC